MLIRIDGREQVLINLVNQSILTIPAFKDLKVVVENLPLGDIILTENEEDKVIIERKSINDLLSSIKDGRYEEQSYRLNGLDGHPNHNIIYLIEGDVNKINNLKNERQTAYSAMFSLNYYKGFSVFRTFSIEETALFICNTASKMLKTVGKTAYYQNKLTDGNTMMDKNTVKDYVSVVKTVKKDNITPNNIAEIMLCQIPGISAATAISIMGKFKTLPNLILCVDSDPTCLNDVHNTNAKGQIRKINKTCIDNINTFLMHKI
jgi:ERCC4-type nuclease